MGNVGYRQGAVVWDFDGTLVDSSERNFRVARRIIRDALGKDETDFPFLASRRSYGKPSADVLTGASSTSRTSA